MDGFGCRQRHVDLRAVLDGTLQVRLGPGHYPSVGTEFVVPTVPSIWTVTADFAIVDLPRGLSYEINTDNVRIVVTSPVGLE